MDIILNAINFASLNITNVSLMYILIPAVIVFAGIISSLIVIRNRRRTNEANILPITDDEQRLPEEEKQTFEQSIEAAGYAYDIVQDIFYSRIDAWQREYGYCRLYDEACAPLSMIIDCEPIYFDYEGKYWLIEFWKGQYGMTAGGEVGVYTSNGEEIVIPGIFSDMFYEAADDDNILEISYTIYKNRKPLFSRQEKHWWLTGFKLGEFAEPYELTMDIKIIFKDSLMLNAFVIGLKNAGYKTNEFRAINNVVIITFDTPYSKQPYTRTEEIELIMQTKNQILCEKFQSATKGQTTMDGKIKALKQAAPDVYGMIFNMGKYKQVFEKFNIIKDYLYDDLNI